MSIPKMANAMGYIDDDLVTGAIEYKRTKKKNSWMKWGAMAACPHPQSLVPTTTRTIAHITRQT